MASSIMDLAGHWKISSRLPRLCLPTFSKLPPRVRKHLLFLESHSQEPRLKSFHLDGVPLSWHIPVGGSHRRLWHELTSTRTPVTVQCRPHLSESLKKIWLPARSNRER